MFVPGNEEKSIENSTENGTDFIVADGVVTETEEEENQEETGDDTRIVFLEKIVID